MISKRYRYGGRSWLPLNPLQITLRDAVEQKIAAGVYRFESTRCVLCESQNNFESIADMDRYGLYMPVVACRKCGLVQTNPRMTADSYAQFYNSEYLRLYLGSEAPHDIFFDGQLGKGMRISEFLVESGAMPSLQGASVLEVGCGTGGILCHFRSLGANVMGVDLARNHAEFGRRSKGLRIIDGTVKDLPSGDTFDLIIYSHVLEHVLNPVDELSQVRRVLGDNGLLYIEVPGLKDLARSCERELFRYLQNAHVYHYTLETLTALMRQCGFEIVNGDNSVRAVFRVAKPCAGALPVGEYAAIRSYLVRNEWMRRLQPWRDEQMMKSARAAVVACLKKIGFYNTMRRAYERMMKRYEVR